jgi:hypothetical protein
MSDSTRRWSHEETEHDRHDLPEGIFANGSAEEIAAAVIEAAQKEGPEDTWERRAIGKLTFYENRAGQNLSDERRATIDKAKEIVRARIIA